MYHLLSEKRRYDEGGDGRAQERDVGVDDGTMVSVTMSQDRVKAGPEDPQQNGPHDREDVRSVTRTLHLFRHVKVSFPVAHEGGRKPEVGAENVNKDSAT